MSQPALQFCSGQAKPMLLSAGGLGLIGSTSTIYFILQAAAFDSILLESHDLKLYSRLAAIFYLALFAGFTIYAATTDHKLANKFLVILALVNIGLAVGAALTIENKFETNPSQLNNQTKTKIQDQYGCSFGCPNVNNSNTNTNTTANNGTDSKQPEPSKLPGTLETCKECKPEIDKTILILTMIFTCLALINLFTLIVSGATVYKTYQYDEASQSTYQ